MQRIGDVVRELGLSADTLRYYEKIGLLPRVARDPSGLRRYESRDLSRLRFIQRAQKMGFRWMRLGNCCYFATIPKVRDRRCGRWLARNWRRSTVTSTNWPCCATS